MSAVNPIFRHGVASGDPLPDSVVLWTRVSVEDQSAPVAWRIARDPHLVEVVADGVAQARADDDWTVHVDAGGLAPATTYYYGFEASGARSPVGRTRTAPAGDPSRLRLGVVSCASWPDGYFTVYRKLAARDVDAVVHLGDYIYETRPPNVRAHHPPAVPLDLPGYRMRYRQYRTDPDVQLLHARHPIIGVWDDHEFSSDAWRGGAVGHDPAHDGPWAARRDAAARAYREWLPLRAPDPADPLRIYRRFSFGTLADLLMLDTRIVGRDEPPRDADRPVARVPKRDRSLLGAPQREWLRTCLRESDARWRILGNQVMLAPLHLLAVPSALRRLARRLGASGGGIGLNAGQWDGYPNEREQLLAFLAEERIGNLVVLTGDLHSSWAAELRHDGQVVGAEFVHPSVTSRSFAEITFPPVPGARAILSRFIRLQNPHVRFVRTEGHGYSVVDVTPARVLVQWWHVDSVRERDADEHLVASWTVLDGGALVPTPAGADEARGNHADDYAREDVESADSREDVESADSRDDVESLPTSKRSR